MKTVSLNKDFSERNGKYEVSFGNYSDINMYTVSSEYYNANYKEDLEVYVAMNTKDGVVIDLSVNVNVINVKRISKRRELIAFEVKQIVAKHIEQIKSRHNNVLDINFIKDVVSFILNYNVCNRYEVVIEDEVEAKVEAKVEEANVIVDEAKVVEEVIKPKKVDKVGFDRGFNVKVNGLAKTYSYTTEEVETSYGYTTLLCKMEATSTIIVDGEYAVIRVYAEVYDGVVISLNIGESREHKQLESFSSLINAKNVSNEVNKLVEDIRYMASNYAYERDYAFIESVMTMVLNINSYNSDTCLYNNSIYSLSQIA